MVTQKSLNPGNAHVRIGSCLAAFEEAFFRGDLASAANALGVLEAYANVFLKEAEWEEYGELPGYATGDSREPWEVARDMKNQLAHLLRAVRKDNIFSRAEITMGDGSGLDSEEPIEATP